MEDFIILGGVAAFASFIGCLIGYHVKEKRHGADIQGSREAFEAERKAWRKAINIWRTDAEAYKVLAESLEETISKKDASLQETHRRLAAELLRGTDVVAELESQVDRAFLETKRVQAELQPYADAMWNAIVINHLPGHGSAEEQLNRIINWEVQMALDPSVSKVAKNLITRGKREMGKKMRTKIAKLEQQLSDARANWDNEFKEHSHTMGEKVDFSSAVRHTLNDKVGLVGVRRSLKNAIGAEYDRLREVRKKNEAISDFVGDN